jgi:ketopantoate reductase
MSERAPVPSGPVLVVGLGQLGSIFATGFLKSGAVVVPVLRGSVIPDVDAQLVLLAVGEDDLAPALASVPLRLRDRVVLLSNELAPDDWQDLVAEPTCAIVWFEKKAGRAEHVIAPTLVFGPHAERVRSALALLGIASEVRVEGRDFELVRKTLYILCSNFGGLEFGGTTGELAQHHADALQPIFDDVLAIEQRRAGNVPMDPNALRNALFSDLFADPNHAARGRTSEARLRRTLGRAKRFGIHVETLEALAKKHL